MEKRRRIYHCAPHRIDDSNDIDAIRAWIDDDDVCHAPRARDVVRYLLATVEDLRAKVPPAPPPDQAPSCPRAPPLKSENIAMPPHPPDDGVPRPKWNSKWDFDRGELEQRERVRLVVQAYGPDGQKETIDAREFIERLGETPEGTTFAIHVETEQIESKPHRER